jgi:hypothetical protein
MNLVNTSRTRKREYLKGRINELEINSKKKYIKTLTEVKMNLRWLLT